MLAMLLIVPSFGQDIFGKWKTVDEESGEVRSIVKIYEEGNKAYGDVLKVFPDPDEPDDPVCNKCPDDRKGERVVGMQIIRGLEKDGEEWEDGTILDPEKGKIYDCKIWREGDKLKVRGYVAFFYRTQTWLPVTN